MVKLKITKYYQARVEEVHSGDDLILMVDLGFDNQFKRVRARLLGVDTPDAYKANASTEAGKVRDKVRILTKDKRCVIDVHSSRRGGWIVTLYTQEDENEYFNINESLMVMGFVYNTGKYKEEKVNASS